MENNTLCNRHSLGVNNHTKMYVTIHVSMVGVIMEENPLTNQDID